MNYSLRNAVKKMMPGVMKGACLIGIASILCANLAGMASRDIESVAEVTEAVPTPTPTQTPDPTVACGSFINPTEGVISSGFGERWGRAHTGVDIAGDTGDAIVAADAGAVVYADWMSGYGNYIIIDHENGTMTAYAHCDELFVSEGDRVTQGQLIAHMGSTGNSTGPHLHFEIKVDNEYQDPLGYVTY